jgi:hypothetical protein
MINDMIDYKQFDKIRRNQDKENCYIDVGDLIEIRTQKNKVYRGEITDIGVRIQNGTEDDGIHPFVEIGILPRLKELSNLYSDYIMIWVDYIANIKVLRLGAIKNDV